MRRTAYLWMIVTIFAALLFVACSGTNQSEPTSPSVNEPNATNTAVPPTAVPTNTPMLEPTNTAVPTETPEPTNTPVPEKSQEELLQEWQSPVIMSIMTYSTCEVMLSTAQEADSGEITPFETLGGLIVVRAMLSGLTESFFVDGTDVNVWASTPDMETLMQSIDTNLRTMQRLFNQWVNEEITPGQIATELEGQCDGMQADTVTIRLAAIDAGLDSNILDESLQEWAEEAQRRFEEGIGEE